jgi:CPA1 family monovalent cation:H+ antiporter
MLNDASALVMLRTAIAAMGATTSISGALGEFGLSVVIATAIGGVVGYLTLVIRKRIHQATVNTLLSFAVPLIAFEPAEHAGASGLVAVVAAGLVIGQGAPRFLSPTHRANERINWHTIEMLLEGGLFLVMGLQLVPLLREARTDLPLAVMLSALALLITLGVRAAYTIPLFHGMRVRRRRYEAARDKLDAMNHPPTAQAKAALADHEARTVERIQSRVRRVLADANYERDTPLGMRDAVLIIWAGMRGAITLAAAQTLPETFPHRSLVLLVAFFVATASLLIQGGTVAWVVRRLKFPPPDEDARAGERAHLLDELETVGMRMLNEPAIASAYGDNLVKLMSERLAQSRDTTALARSGELVDRIFDAQRSFILDARRGGVYSTEALAEALQRIDAMQIGLGITRRGRVVDGGE